MKRLATILATLMLLTVVGVAPASATTEHCPDKDNPNKVEGGDINDFVPEAGSIVCVKGSTDATGKVTADGEQTVYEILGNGHDVSYYIVYETPTTPPGNPGGPGDTPPLVTYLRYAGYIAGPCGDPRVKFAMWNKSDVKMQFKISYISGKFKNKKIKKQKVLTVKPWTKKYTPWLWAKGMTPSTLRALDNGRWVLVDKQYPSKSKAWGTYECIKRSRTGLRSQY